MANTIYDWTVGFFKAEYDSVRKMLNLTELFKSILSGVAAGGGFLVILSAIQKSLGTIITDPHTLKNITDIITEVSNKQWPLLAVTIIGLIADAVRRYNQGESAVIVPIPDVKKN
jgi:hypothetical protein